MPSSLRNSKLLLASHNPGKIKEFESLLAPLGVTLEQFETTEKEAPEETGDSFEENAFIKAQHAARLYSGWILADDSGLEIEALGDQPGIYTGRWYKKAGGVEQVAELLQEKLGHSENKKARFVCVLCLYHPDVGPQFFKGTIEGEIVFPPRGENSFGYDPIFRPLGETRTFAQMTVSEKHAISHRALAIQELVQAF